MENPDHSVRLPRAVGGGVVVAIETTHERRGGSLEALLLRARAWVQSPPTVIFFWSRAGIWVVALFALFVFQPNRNPAVPPSLSVHDGGYAIDLWGHWDGRWYVGIAQHGYGWRPGDAAFYPLYPFAVSVLARALGDHYVVAAVLISLAACAAAFSLLYRIAEPRLGPDGARRAVLYLSVFPMSLFLQAAYTESLFLALALAAFLFAEDERWLAAWAATGFALLARGPAVALVPALALLAWRSPNRRRALAGVPVAAGLFALFPLVLWRE